MGERCIYPPAVDARLGNPKAKGEEMNEKQSEKVEVKRFTSNKVEAIEITSILPSPMNTRRSGVAAELEELAASIKAQGVLQPVTARYTDEKAPELIFGHRRLEAAKLAGLTVLPVIFCEMDDAQVIQAQLIENVQRADIHPMDEAEAYEALLKKHDMSAEDIAAKAGKSRTFIYGRMKLLALVPEARKAFLAGELSPSVALLLARIPVEELQNNALAEINPEWRQQDGRPIATAEALRTIESGYMLNLSAASFSKKDVELVPAAGSCIDCENRTGNQAELFADIKSADMCTDPGCYAEKREAHWVIISTKAKENLEPVLSDSEAKKKFSGTYLNYNCGFKDLADDCPQSEAKKPESYKRFFAKAKVEVEKILARDGGGNVRELVADTELARALKAAGVKGSAIPPSTSSASRNPAQKAQDNKTKAAKATGRRAVDAIAAKAATVKTLGPGFWRLLLELVIPSVHSFATKRVFEHLGVTKLTTAWGEPSAGFTKTLSKLPENEARSIVLELLLTERLEYVSTLPPVLKKAAAFYRVDLKKIAAQVKAEAKPKKKKAPVMPKRSSPASSSKRPAAKKKASTKKKPARKKASSKK